MDQSGISEFAQPLGIDREWLAGGRKVLALLMPVHDDEKDVRVISIGALPLSELDKERFDASYPPDFDMVVKAEAIGFIEAAGAKVGEQKTVEVRVARRDEAGVTPLVANSPVLRSARRPPSELDPTGGLAVMREVTHAADCLCRLSGFNTRILDVLPRLLARMRDRPVPVPGADADESEKLLTPPYAYGGPLPEELIRRWQDYVYHAGIKERFSTRGVDWRGTRFEAVQTCKPLRSFLEKVITLARAHLLGEPSALEALGIFEGDETLYDMFEEVAPREITAICRQLRGAIETVRAITSSATEMASVERLVLEAARDRVRAAQGGEALSEHRLNEATVEALTQGDLGFMRISRSDEKALAEKVELLLEMAFADDRPEIGQATGAADESSDSEPPDDDGGRSLVLAVPSEVMDEFFAEADRLKASGKVPSMKDLAAQTVKELLQLASGGQFNASTLHDLFKECLVASIQSLRQLIDKTSRPLLRHDEFDHLEERIAEGDPVVLCKAVAARLQREADRMGDLDDAAGEMATQIGSRLGDGRGFLGPMVETGDNALTRSIDASAEPDRQLAGLSNAYVRISGMDDPDALDCVASYKTAAVTGVAYSNAANIRFGDVGRGLKLVLSLLRLFNQDDPDGSVKRWLDREPLTNHYDKLTAETMGDLLGAREAETRERKVKLQWLAENMTALKLAIDSCPPDGRIVLLAGDEVGFLSWLEDHHFHKGDNPGLFADGHGLKAIRKEPPSTPPPAILAVHPSAIRTSRTSCVKRIAAVTCVRNVKGFSLPAVAFSYENDREMDEIEEAVRQSANFPALGVGPSPRVGSIRIPASFLAGIHLLTDGQATYDGLDLRNQEDAASQCDYCMTLGYGQMGLGTSLDRLFIASAGGRLDVDLYVNHVLRIALTAHRSGGLETADLERLGQMVRFNGVTENSQYDTSGQIAAALFHRGAVVFADGRGYAFPKTPFGRAPYGRVLASRKGLPLEPPANGEPGPLKVPAAYLPRLLKAQGLQTA